MISYRCLGRAMAGTRYHLDQGTAERLLNGDPVGAEHRSLATVLTAAAASGRPTELRGRSAALAAFRAAADLPSTQPEEPSKLRSALVRMLTVKTALLTALAVGTGGVALAAGTVVFSRPPSNHAEAQQPASPSPAPPSPAASPTPVTPSPPPTTTAPTTPPPRSPQATQPTVVTGSTPPSLVVLCRAYLAEVIRAATSGHDGDTSLSAGIDSPVFDVLITAAGGRAAVVAFCTVVLSTAPNDGTGGPPIVDPHDGHGTLPGRQWNPTPWPPNRSAH